MLKVHRPRANSLQNELNYRAISTIESVRSQRTKGLNEKNMRQKPGEFLQSCFKVNNDAATGSSCFWKSCAPPITFRKVAELQTLNG